MAICPDWLCDLVLGPHANDKKVVAKFRLEAARVGYRRGVTDCATIPLVILRKIGDKAISRSGKIKYVCQYNV